LSGNNKAYTGMNISKVSMKRSELYEKERENLCNGEIELRR